MDFKWQHNAEQDWTVLCYVKSERRETGPRQLKWVHSFCEYSNHLFAVVLHISLYIMFKIVMNCCSRLYDRLQNVSNLQAWCLEGTGSIVNCIKYHINSNILLLPDIVHCWQCAKSYSITQ